LYRVVIVVLLVILRWDRLRCVGRYGFIIRQRGFLEPMSFAPGRHVTALGEFVGIESRSVGAFPLDHPVLEVRQIELWPVEPNSARGNVHFGIGVRL